MIPMPASGCLATVFGFTVFKTGVSFPLCLLIEVYGLECDFIFPQMHCCGGHVRVVTENDDPVFLNNGLQPFSLGFERLQRIKVIRHDPWQSYMVASGKKIDDEEK